MHGSDGGEVAVIQGCELHFAETFTRGDDRGIDDADRRVGVAIE